MLSEWVGWEGREYSGGVWERGVVMGWKDVALIIMIRCGCCSNSCCKRIILVTANAHK